MEKPPFSQPTPPSDAQLPAVIEERDRPQLPVPVGPVRTHPMPRGLGPWSWQRLAIVGALCAFTAAALIYRRDGHLPNGTRAPASLASTSEAVAPRGRALTRTELNDRIRDAIAQTAHMKVVYEDVLGEGEGAWDAHPRMPSTEVNCIVWITHVLAQAYGRDAADKLSISDRLRYFEGTPAFGLRKHFNAHWAAVEPAPLRPYFPEACAPFLSESVDLDPARLAKNRGYSCPLYRMDLSRVTYEYTRPATLDVCAGHLQPGFYVLFGVETTAYAQKYGKASGPMGLVHGMFLEVGLAGEAWIHHASTAAGKIKREKLAGYLKRMAPDLHKGYTLYDLDPEWLAAETAPSLTPDAQRTLDCERALPDKRKIEPAFATPRGPKKGR